MSIKPLDFLLLHRNIDLGHSLYIIIIFIILKLKILYCCIIKYKPEKLYHPDDQCRDSCLDQQLQYIYINIKNAKWKYTIMPIFILLCILIGIFLFTNNYFEKTMAEIELYSDLSLQSSIEQRGLYNYFFKLPHGFRELGILLFTQINPFPITISFIGAITFSHYFLATIYSLSGIWFFISYSLIILLIFKKGWRLLKTKDHIILLLALLFLLANTAELNVRRMLPVYPILFYYFLILKRKMKWVNQQQLRINLIIIYTALNCFYILIKQYN